MTKEHENAFEPDPLALRKIETSKLFDAAWYREQYGDVALLGMDPHRHFLRYGRLLKRSPGPDFDTRFYLQAYTDVGDENPLLHFLKTADRDRRHTTLAALKASLVTEQGVPNKQTPLHVARKQPVISYCIPIMGRLSDLQGTLQTNLLRNQSFRDKVEFVIIEFGEDSTACEWVTETFADALVDGYLRTFRDKTTMDSWHFGKAKNAFRHHLRGQIYSSLDADNFVTWDETRQLLELVETYPGGFVFHHFSGKWGDGTSGRVSMPAAMYRQVGYDTTMLPRQFDEIDIILGALTEFPAVPFVGLEEERNIFTLSGSARNYFKNEALPNRRLFLGDLTDRVAPLNPRGAGYTERHPHWREMGNFNAAFSAYHRSHDPERKQGYLNRLTVYKHRLIELLPPPEVISTLFLNTTQSLPKITSSDICLVACVHDEESFLPHFIAHHRALGVTRFLIVDDNSTRQVSDLELGEDVFSVRPKVGTFRTSKTLWIEGLLRALVPDGTWVCTLDADELLQVPERFDGLEGLSRLLEAQNRDFACCLLLDMLPDPAAPAADLSRAEEEFDTIFAWFCDKRDALTEDYANHQSIKWGFGPYADLSFRHDARYHAFGTFDSLRKLSLFRYWPDRHLNQGFHSFHFTDGRPAPGHDIWQNTPILPIFHYKLIRLFSDRMREKMLGQSGGYHARTEQNISSIFGADSDGRGTSLSRLTPHLRPAAEALKPDFFSPVFAD